MSTLSRRLLPAAALATALFVTACSGGNSAGGGQSSSAAAGGGSSSTAAAASSAGGSSASSAATGSATASAAGGGSGTTTDVSGKVFMLLPNTTTTRFEARDKPLFVDAMKKYAPNIEVVSVNAEGDPDKQQQQVDNAIAQGAKAIVLVSADANLAAGSLNAAQQANVPVVLYEHDAKGGPAAVQVSFDALKVGQAQGKRAKELIDAMPGDGLKIARIKGNPGEYGTEQYQKGQDEYLQPLIDSGKIQVVCEQNITNWDPVEGQAFMDDCLTKQADDINLVISMNDGLAGAAIAALQTQNLAGKIMVTGGQDANVEALQNIIRGQQDNTIFKNLSVMADDAAQATASVIATGKPDAAQVNGAINNDFADIPAVLLPVENVTIDNLQDVVDSGTWTWAQICQGIEDTDVCKQKL